LYFEVVTTLALGIGMIVANVVQPGRGMNVNPATLDIKSVAQYTTQSQHLSAVDFLLNIIPDTFVGAFAKGEILQVLFLAILTGVALATLDQEQRLIDGARALSSVCYRIISIIMEAAPLGAFGAMAFTVGKYGIATLLTLGKLLLCVYITSLSFVAIVLGLICYMHDITLWKFLRYIREEIIIALGTSASEPVLPRMLIKMEQLGCSRAVV